MNHITEIQIVPIKPKDGLVAFASLVLDEKLYLSSIGVYTKLDGTGYRITYPTKILGERGIQIFHPINKELSEAMEEAIFAKVSEVMERSNNDGHHQINATTW